MATTKVFRVYRASGIFDFIEFFFHKIQHKAKKTKNSCFRKCGWREKSSPGMPQNYFFYRFSRDILFSSLVCFAFLYSFFVCLFLCFFRWNIYILVHIELHERMSYKKISTWLIFKNKTPFFGLKFCIWISNCIICGSLPFWISNRIFKKEGLAGPQLLEGGCWERAERLFSSGEVQFSHEK